jgi:release factor glutamine methyltransferase
LKVLEVLKLASEHLGRHGSESARLDAEVMLATALGLRRLDLYLQFDRPLSESELSVYRGQVARRANGEPVAYVTGHKEFMALDFEVTPSVLVPNPDTELIVQLAVAWARESGLHLRVADVGTGSGCIAVAVAHYAPNVEMWASDVSADALEVAGRNIARHSLEQRIHLACGDLMEPLPGTFDLVCANLPYLDSDTLLPADVVSQPSVALYAGGGGADVVLRLLEEVPARLDKGGRVLVELDPAILPSVLEVAGRNFAGHRTHHDLGGHERVLEAWC